MIEIKFTIDKFDGAYVFSDTLYLPENHGLTDIEIEAMKQTRHDKWYDFVTNQPSVVDEPITE